MGMCQSLALAREVLMCFHQEIARSVIAVKRAMNKYLELLLISIGQEFMNYLPKGCINYDR